MKPEETPVRMGEIVVRRALEAPAGLRILGLGSCLAVFIHEAQGELGGLAHVMLPAPRQRSPLTRPGLFAPTAVSALVDTLLRRGARRDRLAAKLAGGARIFSGTGTGQALGTRNVRAVLAGLTDEGIPLLARDVGGRRARSLVACLRTGRLTVRTLGGVARSL